MGSYEFKIKSWRHVINLDNDNNSCTNKNLGMIKIILFKAILAFSIQNNLAENN